MTPNFAAIVPMKVARHVTAPTQPYSVLIATETSRAHFLTFFSTTAASLRTTLAMLGVMFPTFSGTIVACSRTHTAKRRRELRLATHVCRAEPA